jgi:hypothetical protein
MLGAPHRAASLEDSMRPLRYHHGQIQVQEEASSRHVADKLAHWVGPAISYALDADLALFALADPDGVLRFVALSGPPPMMDVAGPGVLRFHPALSAVAGIRGSTVAGGLVISLARAERARLNGTLHPLPDGALALQPEEVFTLCRKYIMPTAGTDLDIVAGPERRDALDLDDPWVAQLVASAETSFLASVAPDGAPDVAHRGGPRGFLSLDPAQRLLTWPEYVGDGVFKSAGNVRATGTATLLIPDFASGDALELVGQAAYETFLRQRRPRTDPLLRFRDPFPVQGRMTLRIEAARRLRRFAWPRQAAAGDRVTSQSAVGDQAPA